MRRVVRRAGDQRTSDGRGWALGPDASVKGQVWRSMRCLADGDRDRLIAAVRRQAHRGELEESNGTVRLWLDRAAAPYPAVESCVVVAPAGVADKQRTAFDELWDYVRGLDLPRQLDLAGAR